MFKVTQQIAAPPHLKPQTQGPESQTCPFPTKRGLDSDQMRKQPEES